MVRQIVIELETPGDSRTMFRLRRQFRRTFWWEKSSSE